MTVWLLKLKPGLCLNVESYHLIDCVCRCGHEAVIFPVINDNVERRVFQGQNVHRAETKSELKNK